MRPLANPLSRREAIGAVLRGAKASSPAPFVSNASSTWKSSSPSST